MANSSQSKDDALETLDFIVNVLKDHEKDLDKLINELATVTEQLGETGVLTGKVEAVEEKINGLQNEVTNLIAYLSSNAPKEALPAKANAVKEQTFQVSSVSLVHGGPSVVLTCKQWEDFQSLAFQAQTVSFNCKENEKVFQANALKSNQVITYSGTLPKSQVILKTWLSQQLSVPEKNILEGFLTKN